MQRAVRAAMNESGGRPPPRQVPTLTEIVDADEGQPSVSAPVGVGVGHTVVIEATAAGVPPLTVRAPSNPADESLMAEQLAARVLADVQRHIDLTLEQRLREMLTPTLARLTDALMHDSREQLAVVLRELVARAVAQEIERRRQR